MRRGRSSRRGAAFAGPRRAWKGIGRFASSHSRMATGFFASRSRGTSFEQPTPGEMESRVRRRRDGGARRLSSSSTGRTNSVAKFAYEGTDDEGKLHKGELEAPGLVEASAQLRARGVLS